MDDVKVEVMRARGAGGQARSSNPIPPLQLHGLTSTRSM